ncbi:glycosyltransferase family 2 protein [Halanaerocella petrolearia]
MNKKVSVLIPAYNEVDRIGTTIETVKEIETIDEIIVVDDGSKDKTFSRAKKAGIKAVKLEENQGKGAALNYGLSYVRGDIILLIDADLQKTAIEIEKLLTPLLREEADMAIAKFPPPKVKGGLGLVKGLARWGLEKITNQRFQAPLSGQRAITKELAAEISGFAAGFGVEVALTIEAYRAGFEVVEVPVQMAHRETGRNIKGFCHRGKQFKDVLMVLSRKLVTKR